jgi:hypothetical protein
MHEVVLGAALAVPLPLWERRRPPSPFASRACPTCDGRGRHALLMEGYGYRWYRVGGLDYLLKRSDIDETTTGKVAHPA